MESAEAGAKQQQQQQREAGEEQEEKAEEGAEQEGEQQQVLLAAEWYGLACGAASYAMRWTVRENVSGILAKLMALELPHLSEEGMLSVRCCRDTLLGQLRTICIDARCGR